jgi:GntR family transcriptional repressor for pyruvate dehydrogenase complex
VVRADKGPTLTRRTEEALRQRIISGPLRAGERLPTEKALAEEFGVSRTVVREAVAALRADGLLEARHGVGVFVAAGANGMQQAGAHDSAISVLDRFELRMAVEVQAAGLAAARRTWAQEAQIWQAHEAMRAAIESCRQSEDADFAFHRAVAEATNNAAFVAFINGLGPRALPRTALQSGAGTSLISPAYLKKVQADHRRIFDAIASGNVEGAREAMNAHLANSQSRYRGLIEAGRSDQALEE